MASDQQRSDPDAEASAAASGGLAVPLWVAAAVYAALCFAVAAEWNFAHDEGVTWEQAVGALPIPTHPEPASPFASLEPWLAGERPVEPAAVVERLGESGGMHPPLYYLAYATWVRGVGAWRPLGVVPWVGLGVGLLGVVAIVARRLAPDGGSLAPTGAVWLLATSPWWIGFSVYSRPYAWVVVLAAAGLYCAWQAAAEVRGLRASWHWRAGFVAVSWLSLYSLYHSAFVVLWQGGALFALACAEPAERRRAAIARVVGLGVVIAAGFAPWLPVLAEHLAETNARPWYFSDTLPLAEWPMAGLRALRFFALGPAELAPGLGSAALVLGLPTAVAIGASLRSSAWRALSAEARAFVGVALVMPLGILASDLQRDTHTFFLTKIHYAWALLLPLLVSRAASQLPWPRVGRGLVISWVALQLVACAVFWDSLRAPTPLEVRAAEIARSDDEGHRIAISTRLHGYAQPLVRALAEAGVADSRIVHVPARAVGRYVAEAVRDPEVGSISMVNLGAFYMPGAMWRASHAQAGFDAAAAAGWSIVSEDGLSEAAPRAISRSFPLQVVYFSK